MNHKDLNILVVGGAGYIGSHMVKTLFEKKCKIITLDNLSGGHRDAVLHGDFIEGDVVDEALLDTIFSKYSFDAVMHFASYINVGESVSQPREYYNNNLINTLKLIDAMLKYGVGKFIFSSTAAIFGEPKRIPINESHPHCPINPYGRSKLMVEQALADYDHAYGMKSVCLRYFNAAGADPSGKLGERHNPETHLIPLILQAASGRRESISIYGSNYDTADGTCVRDYIHVTDLCEAHWFALELLMNGGGSHAFNLGNGGGFSVQEIVDLSKKITKKEILVLEGSRREGDPAILVADSSQARKKLGWQPKYSSLESIIEHAWAWEKLHGTEW